MCICTIFPYSYIVTAHAGAEQRDKSLQEGAIGVDGVTSDGAEVGVTRIETLLVGHVLPDEIED